MKTYVESNRFSLLQRTSTMNIPKLERTNTSNINPLTRTSTVISRKPSFKSPQKEKRRPSIELSEITESEGSDKDE
jgi:hypothetical protein